MVGIVKCLEEAVRQTRAIFPHATPQEVTRDIEDIVLTAREEAGRRFPTDSNEQERFIETTVSAAVQRALGSLTGRIMH
jgi:hypothetical protein